MEQIAYNVLNYAAHLAVVLIVIKGMCVFSDWKAKH